MAKISPYMKYLIILLISFLIISCNTENQPDGNSQTFAVESNDLRSILENGGRIENTEFFTASGLKDSVYETESGIVMVVPRGAFIDEDGEIVEEEITIELAEANSLDEFLRAKLLSVDDSLLQGSERMIYLNATANGKSLSINEKSPVYIEFPVADPFYDKNNSSAKDLKIFKGVRDGNGVMHWLNPVEPERFLVPINQSLIDYYPFNFEYGVLSNLPINGHKTKTKQLTDSLLYALTQYCMPVPDSIYIGKQIGDVSDTAALAAGEAYTDTLIMYTKGGYEKIHTFMNSANNHPDVRMFEINQDYENWQYDSIPPCNCVNTASIKVIRDEKFANTFLATREFANRLKVIYGTGNNRILDYYINNLNKNLYECDLYAANTLEFSANKFQAFADEKLTNVKGADLYTKELSKYYNKQLSKIEKQLKEDKKKLDKLFEKDQKEYEKAKEEYKTVLHKRLNYRMKKLGFKATSTGWVNVKNDVVVESDGPIMNITVANGKAMNKTYAYFEQSNIKSIYALQSNNNVNFYEGPSEDSIFAARLGVKGKIYAIGFNDTAYFFAENNFNISVKNIVELQLVEMPEDSIKHQLQQFQKNYKKHNSIWADFEYQKEFNDYKNKQKSYYDNQSLMLSLSKYIGGYCWIEGY